MRKAIRLILVLPFMLLLIFLLFLSIRYSPVYVYRLIALNVADVYDYTHFDNRALSGADSTFQFAEKPDEDYVESLFKDRIAYYGFSTFDEWAERSKTTAFIFIRNDTILYEKYYNGFSRDSYFHSQSMAKSFISFLIGAAIDDGIISSVDDPMTKYIPELMVRDKRFEKITLRDLLEMRSGLEYFTGYFPGTGIHLPWHDEAVGYYHDNVRKLLLEDVDIAAEPGQSFQYCNYNTSYLGMIIERATSKSVSAYLEEKLWSRIMEYNALFSIDSKESGFEYMPSRLIARAIDYARFGRLFLKAGSWNGEQIIPRDWIDESTSERTSIDRGIYPSWFGSGCNRVYYSYHWWGHANCDSTYNYAASGNLGQSIYIIPHKDIIIVHCGNSPDYYSDHDLWIASKNINP